MKKIILFTAVLAAFLLSSKQSNAQQADNYQTAIGLKFGGYENGFALTEPDPGTVHGKPGWWCRRCRSHKRVREVQLALVVEESADGLPRRSSEKQHRLSSRLIRQLVLSE